MKDQTDVYALMEEKLSYWKSYISIQDLLDNAFSYSLIYDNVRPDKIVQALETVGLETLPDRFFLIQVDDYHNRARKLRTTQECYQKINVIHLLRGMLRKMDIPGFAANLEATEMVICFLCCAEKNRDETFVLKLAEQMKELVRLHTPYTISVCISQPCTHLVHYSRMYPHMQFALEQSYFSGKECTILLTEKSEREESAVPVHDFEDCLPNLLAAISGHNEALLDQTLEKIFQTMLTAPMQPQKTRMEMIHLIQRIGTYCVQCGVPESRMLACNEEAIHQILRCSFILDTQDHFRTYCCAASQVLHTCADSKERSFLLIVEEYLAAHFCETVRVKDVAALMGFSEGHFIRLFSQKTGKTFSQYLNECRLQKSEELLRDTRIPIEQIAEQVGVNSQSYFCTWFKQHTGISPGAFRREKR